MAWQRRVLRRSSAGLPVVQHDPLARLRHRDEAPLGHLPARPHEPEPRPQAHGLRLVRPGGTLRPVLQQHRPLWSEPPVLPVVDGHPMGVGDDQAGVRQPAHGELLPGHLHGVPQRHLLGFVDPQILQEAEDPVVAVSSCTSAGCQVVQQLGLLQRPQHRGPAEGILHGW